MSRSLVRSCLAICLSGFCLLGLQAADADKDALRYDGKPFEYWRTYMRTELKSERRIEGLRALAAFGVRGHAEEAAKAIVEVVKDYGSDAYGGNAERATPDQKVILEATEAVFKIGPAAFEVILRNAKNDRLRMFASEFAPQPGGNNRYEIVLSAPAATILLDYLQGEQGDVQAFAVSTLGYALDLRLQTEEITQKILREKKDTEALARRLTALLETESSSGIVAILKAMGPRAKSAARVLVKARLRGDFKDDAIFEAIGVETMSLLPAIQEGLKSDEAAVRERAAFWIGSMGTKAKAALPALLQEVKDGPKKESKAEKTSSAPVGYSSPYAEGGTNEEGAWLAALDAAIAVGGERPQLVPSMIRIVGDRTRTFACRLAVVNKLTDFGKQAKEAVPILVTRFSDDRENAGIRTQALVALEAIGFENRQVVPALVEAIESEMEENPRYNSCTSDVSKAALRSLVKVHPQSRESTTTLIRAFAQYTHQPQLRAAIAPALGAMGPAARAALPALREATKADEGYLRKAAKAAIEKIDK